MICGISHLADALAVNTSLKTLLLHVNWIDTMGRWLSWALPGNESLTELDLSFNFIGAPAALWLAEGLRGKCQVKILDLAHNRLCSTAVAHLTRALGPTSPLAVLVLNVNPMGVDGAWYLGEAMKGNSNLFVLQMCLSDIDTSILVGGDASCEFDTEGFGHFRSSVECKGSCVVC
jgi:Ran GTPase-activating protein (RanGAP) involved in mRNA processing and transport